MEQSDNTITFLPVGNQKPTVISKRDLGIPPQSQDDPCCSKEADRRDAARKKQMQELDELPTPSEQSNSNESHVMIHEQTEQALHSQPISSEEEIAPSAPKQITKKTNPLVQIRKKARKAQQKKKVKQTNIQPTIWKHPAESESEDEIRTQIEPTSEKTTKVKDEPAANQSRSAQQTEEPPQKIKRGERAGMKRNFMATTS